MAFVQQNATISGGGASSQATAFSSNVVKGDLLTVYVHINATATTTINIPTDTVGTVYTAAHAIIRQAGIGSAQVFYGVAAASGANTVTVGITGGTDAIYVGVMEHAGWSTLHDGNGVGGSSTTPTSPTIAANPSDLTVGFCFASGTAAAAGGAASRSTFNGDCLEDATGATSAAFTMAPTGAWIACAATFTVTAPTPGAPLGRVPGLRHPLTFTRRLYAPPPITAAAAVVYNDSGSGTITLSGTATESQAHSATPSGTITLSGTSTQSQSHSASAAGTITLSGSFTQSLTAADSGAGSVTLPGTFTQSASAADSGAGTITLSGTASETFVPPGGPSYTFVASAFAVLRRRRLL